MAIGMSSRGGARIRVIVLHTAEGARTKESLYAYFDKPGINASSHVGIDGRGISPQWVPDHMASWTLRSGNPYSLNAELCGFARWTRQQWLHTGWVDGCWNPREMIRNAARWTVREAREHQIPLRLLSIAQFRAGKAGSIDHDLYTDATHDGTHWDVGEGFPFDVFMSDVRHFSGGGGGAAPGGGDDMPLSTDDLRRMHDAMWHGVDGGKLISVREPGKPNGWAEYVLGSMSDWIVRQQLAPLRAQVGELVRLVGQREAVTAEDIAAALRAGLTADLLPVLREVVGEALGDDNAETANQIADSVLDRLGARLQEGTTA